MSSIRLSLSIAVIALFGSACGSPKVKCLPSNCSGCCDASGACVAIPTAAACGLRGSACQACTGGGECIGGFCSGSSFGGGGGELGGGAGGGGGVATGGGGGVVTGGGGGTTGGGGGTTGGGGGTTGGGGGTTGGGGGTTGGGGGATGGGGGTPDTAAQLTAVRSAADLGPGAISLPVQGALVTFLKPAVAGAGASDPAGFFVQAGASGPALFVAVDPASLPVAVGDLVSFTVTSVARNNQVRVAGSISGFTKQSSGNPVSGLAQNVTATDFSLAAAIDAHESELISLSGALTGDLAASGAGYQAAALTTSGNTSATSMKLRLPNALADSEGLGTGCSVQLTATPLWRQGTEVNPSAWSSSQLAGSSCPAPRLLSASALSSTSVRAQFDRPMNPFSVTASNLTIAGLTVSAVSGTGTTWTLTTDAQGSGASYTLTASTSVADVRGTPINASMRTAPFTGFVTASGGGVVINEVDYDNAPDAGFANDNLEFIELFNAGSSTASLANRAVVLINGANNLSYTTVDLSPAGSLAPGEYLVLASDSTLTTVPASAKKLSLGGPNAIDLIQNGATDGLVLLDTSTHTVLDALSYEGSTTWNSDAGVLMIQEGTASTTTLADGPTANVSVCRVPNGQDTNVNATDFKVCSMPTPGVVNVP